MLLVFGCGPYVVCLRRCRWCFFLGGGGKMVASDNELLNYMQEDVVVHEIRIFETQALIYLLNVRIRKVLSTRSK
jgi:hypothetical protein